MTEALSVGEKQRSKLLLLEDMMSDAEIIKEEVLNSGIQADFKVVATEEAFVKCLDNWKPDIILADYTLINFNGLKALKLVRERSELIPFIFVTGTLSIEKAVDTLHNGATDFILKENISSVSKAVLRAFKELRHLRAVEESEKRFRIMANSAPVMIWIANEQNLPVFFNRTMHDYTGLTNMAEDSVRWTDLLHEYDQSRVIEIVEEGFSNKEEFAVECRYRKFDGEYNWFYTKGVPHMDNYGEFAGYIYSAIDFTEQKKLDDERDSFLSIASHELKTPLTTIKAYNQLVIRLLEQSEEIIFDNQVLEFLKESEKSIDRMKTLITSLLDVSQIRLKQDEYIFNTISLCPVIVNIADSFKVDDSIHRILITCKDDLMVHGDRDKLVQVFTNLLENAIKYSPDGGDIHINIYRDGDDAVTSFRDNGIGMSDKDMNRIFDRFFRSEKDSSKYPGLGIGLYLVSQIIKAHHGRVWVHSKPGKGAEFFISLPLFLENGKNTNG